MTAAKASRTFRNASSSVSPSVTNSGNTGDVTVNPPSGCGEKTNGSFRSMREIVPHRPPPAIHRFLSSRGGRPSDSYSSADDAELPTDLLERLESARQMGF